MIACEVLVPVDDKSELDGMMRDYLTDMATVIAGVDPMQPYPYFDLYWSQPDSRWPFWLKAEGGNAGFALLSRMDATMQIAEFFVARPHRRKGIGRAAARRLIARHPGDWQITQRETNGSAIVFWHRVLDGFVDYKETTIHTDAVRREQHFRFP